MTMTNLIPWINMMVSLTYAYFYGFDLPDLIWSIWTGSLVVGLFILVWSNLSRSLFFRFIAGIFKKKNPPTTVTISQVFATTVGIIVSIVASLYSIGFFVIHFGGFHLVHAFFLYGALDLDPGFGILIPHNPTGKNPFSTMENSTSIFPFIGIATFLLKKYWFIILLNFVDRLSLFLNLNKTSFNDFMVYKSVIKMHVYIFILAGLSEVFGNQTSKAFPVFLITYALFFAPIPNLFDKFLKKKITNNPFHHTPSLPSQDSHHSLHPPTDQLKK